MRLKMVMLISTLLCTAGSAAAGSAATLYLQAEEKYQHQGYEEAVSLLESAIAMAPRESRYHHLLGKCYGRMAETAGSFQAFSLARKTRRQFEKAVELDGENSAALQDLMEYYREAPGFLGGSSRKAAEIAKKLSRLKTGEQRDETQTNQQKDFDSSIM
jgi:tetratricopeptide (TPR) repeat protein